MLATFLRLSVPSGLALLLACASAPAARVTGGGDRVEGGTGPFARSPRTTFQLAPLPERGPATAPQPGAPYTVLSADMEGDGDLDILINWHNFGPLELWENQGGRFWLRNAPGADRSGIYDNRGIPYLFADAAEQLAAIEAEDRPGLWIWHDVDRELGSWRFYARREAPGVPLELGLSANEAFAETRGLTDLEQVQLGPQELLVSLEDAHLGRAFGVRVDKISTQLVVQQSDPALDVFVGLERTPTGSGPVDLWKHDPHGIAWLPPHPGPEPELYVSRGGLMGALLPPNDPKVDFAYAFAPSRDGLYAFTPVQTFERSYGRTRQVEWVDLDRDGTNELYLGNRETANTLAVLDPTSGTYVNRAAEWGLDLLYGEVFGWIDFDDDADEDLVYLGPERLRARRNQGASFVNASPEDLGLVLQGADLGGGGGLERPQILVADFDNDGQLDVLVTTIGEHLGIQLFLRRGDRFVNVTFDAGLSHQMGAAAVVTLDADNDGYLDILSVGTHVTLLHNEGGQSFTPESMPTLPGELFGVAATTDADGDGREDAVLVSERRVVAYNRIENANRFVRVDLARGERLPLGALVSAHYADGSVRVQRFGSADNPKFSQALTPLHFGVANTTTLEAISVRWPVSGTVTVHPVSRAELGTTIEL